MFKPRPKATFCLALTLLPACMAPDPSPPLTIKPHSEIRHTPGARVDHYELGRYYQAHGKLGLAMDAFAQALKLDSRHAAARSALAELYTLEGRLSEAEILLRGVIAQSPAAAYLHNNLGYVYYLQGNNVEAIRQLHTALSLDPNHEWARNNLKLAEAMLERRLAANIQPSPQRAESTVKAFEVWGEINGRKVKLQSSPDAALGIVPDIANAAVPDVAPGVDLVANILSDPASRKPVMEMLPGNQAKTRAAVPLAKLDRTIDARVTDVAATATEKFRLEISNGNGVTGFARRVSQILARQGIPVHRLTNQLPYQQVTTEIQYRDGFEREAEHLKSSLRGYAIVARAGATRNWTDLRVVLGRDLTMHIAEIDTEKPAVLANAKSATGQIW